MLCQICQESAAGIVISHIINNKKIEIKICQSCAEKKGVDNPMTTLPQVFGNFIAELLGEENLRTKVDNGDAKCPGCGLTWDDFQEMGVLGCDVCYQEFRDDLQIILRRIHGSNHHIGNRPNATKTEIAESELEKIKLELDVAIKNEDFEMAAELRDLMRDSYRELDKKQNDGMLR